jgi:hypothetical protein
MATATFCWRCRMDVPMLDDAEWAQMAPRMHARIQSIKDYRQAHGVGIADAREHVDGEVLDLYFEMTGFRETNAEAIWHHHLSHYGPPCTACGKLLRTSRASFCAACGAPGSSGDQKKA